MILMGKDVEYWIQLQARVDTLEVGSLMDDIVGLVKENKDMRGRLAYYESRIDQMNVVRKESIL